MYSVVEYILFRTLPLWLVASVVVNEREKGPVEGFVRNEMVSRVMSAGLILKFNFVKGF